LTLDPSVLGLYQFEANDDDDETKVRTT